MMAFPSFPRSPVGLARLLHAEISPQRSANDRLDQLYANLEALRATGRTGSGSRVNPFPDDCLTGGAGTHADTTHSPTGGYHV
jgi:hypothetical protein